MKPLVIYHANCWDGFCAAWIVRKIYKDCDFHPAHYGTDPPNVTERDVLIVDFSYPRETILNMKNTASSLFVIDHHKTNEEALNGLDFCLFNLDKSGGRLVWEYFFTQQVAPWLVDYTEDRDMWWHKQPNSEFVNAALRSYPLSFELWDEFENSKLDQFILEGKAIRRAEKQIIDTHVHNARVMTMNTWAIQYVNSTILFSEIAGELAKGWPFGACYFDRKDGKRQWSLRSDGKVDVSEIAKKHGGGGHKQAAGFEEVGAWIIEPRTSAGSLD